MTLTQQKIVINLPIYEIVKLILSTFSVNDPRFLILNVYFCQIKRAAELGSDNDCRQLNKKKRKRGKGKAKGGGSSGGGDDDDETEGVSALSPDKQLTCSLILQELNNKMGMVAWKP